jgi:hypothetical protein
MTISYSISNTINYEEVGIGVENPAIVFPAIYGNYEFGYTVTFSSALGTITNVAITSSPAYTDTSVLSANSVRTVKNAITVFPNEDYNFAFFDTNFNKTIETYSAANTDFSNTGLIDSNRSIFAWDTPTSETVTDQYVFTITYINSETLLEETTPATFSQTLQWSQFPGAAILQDLVQRSKY